MKSKTSSKILSGTVRIDQPRRARLHRLSINITPAERVGRIVMGVGAVVAGVVLLASASAILAIVLEVLLIAAGLDQPGTARCISDLDSYPRRLAGRNEGES
jgi:sulfite exporter TauE/SafE